METVVSLLKQVAFIMFIISQPCSLELCLYKVKRGNFGITVQKYPHTQQHIIHKAPRLYITKMGQRIFLVGKLSFKRIA